MADRAFGDQISDADVAAFRATGQFDEQWYIKEYPDVARSRMDPARHYLWIGRRLGRRPSSATVSTIDHQQLVSAGAGAHANLAYETTWHEAFAVAQGARSPSFAPRAMTTVQKRAGLPKLVAFYLPQFHPFKENDEWWGRGFTEWTNVSKAVPQYRGHYQPRLPLDLGFYDLRNIEIMRQQVELAKINGIDAFCFHYYWFDGKRLLEKPVENYLADQGRTLDLPYCLCWANENWTRRWDGSEADILMEQSHSLEDHANVFKDLNRFFADPRYLKIDGKPIIVIYRPAIIRDLDAMVAIWRQAAVTAGFPGIHLIATNSFGFDDPGSIGFDALCEFPPHNVVAAERNNEKLWLNPSHEGIVYAYPEVVDYCTNRLKQLDRTPAARTYYPTVMTSWDNEARKPGRGNSFDGCTPAELHRWLSACVDFSLRHHNPDQGLVFINAWNEWAEGTYLEPDRWLGHAYLWTVRAVIEERQQPDPSINQLVARANEAGGLRQSDGAICLHLFYPDLIDELGQYVDELRAANEALDLLISLPATWTYENVAKAVSRLSPKRIFVTANRGRDVLPFLTVAREAVRMGYRYGCKVHTKKSPHVRGGDRWRRGLYTSLLSVETARAARHVFQREPRCGIYAASGMIKTCSDPSTMRDNLANLDRLFASLGQSAVGMNQFVAGTMFWFRFDALCMALDDRFGPEWFGPELGAIDGTMAHAFERAFVHLSSLAGYRLETYSENIFDPY